MFANLFSNKQPNKSKETDNSNDVKNDLNPEDVNTQIKWIIEKGWTDNYDISKKTLLIMDDREAIISSMIDDLQALDEESPSFVLDNYNILKLDSKMAGFNVFELLEKAPLIEINYALLDIILGGKKVIDGKRKMVDGVDVAISIWNKFEAAQVMFFSGCIIESDGKDIFNFKEKFEDYTGERIEDYILAKDSSFENELNKLMNFFLDIDL